MDLEKKKSIAFELSLQIEALSARYNQLKTEIIREMNSPAIKKEDKKEEPKSKKSQKSNI